MARYKCLLVLAFGYILFMPHGSHGQGSTANDPNPKIRVRISVDRARYRSGDDVPIHVEIWNIGEKDLFIFKNINNTFSNALATLGFRMYQGTHIIGPTMSASSDSFASQRSAYPPLSNELPKYWIALPPQHFYGAEVIITPLWYSKLKVPGKYRVEGKYTSRGFLAEDINNPLLHYAEELKQLPFQAWVGEVTTNSISIEVTK
jgi:hypothetical protein